MRTLFAPFLVLAVSACAESSASFCKKQFPRVSKEEGYEASGPAEDLRRYNACVSSRDVRRLLTMEKATAALATPSATAPSCAPTAPLSGTIMVVSGPDGERISMQMSDGRQCYAVVDGGTGEVSCR